MSHIFTRSATINSMQNERLHSIPNNAHEPLTSSAPPLVHLEKTLSAARPRLLRFARKQGVAFDALDDVVQETFLEAWRHLDRLHTPQGTDAWLNSICHHVCRRWLRAQSTILSRQTSLYREGQETDQGPEAEIADPRAFDPVEELSRQDLTNLLDCALGHLPQSTREAIELCYLDALPQSEAALRLGLTINALQVRLHRAHHQLRQILNGALRAEAELFGVALAPTETSGWRETRMWCNLCGQSRLQGLFEAPPPTGQLHLRLRCPVCSPAYGDMFNSSLGSLDGLHSFRPAFKRAWKAASAYWEQALVTGKQQCTNCLTYLVPLQIVHPSELTSSVVFSPVYRLILDCPRCGITGTCSVVAILNHPDILDFVEQHPRWIIGPEARIEYAGQAALRTSLLDPATATRLTVIVQRQTLQTLALFRA